MCGISGIVDFSRQPMKEPLLESLGTITYRGPDSSGIYIDKNVALGARRLSIIDLATGDQPIKNEDGKITVVFNGEIYNFQTLRQNLLKSGHRFKTRSDTEVLVHLYERYGEDMVKHLNGMFAFAIWDKKKQKLFLARDHVGIKPLYYFQHEDKLIFGSELKVILAYGRVAEIIDRQSLILYSYLGYIPGKSTIFKSIYKLRPGHYLVFSKTGIRIKRYYHLKIGNKESTKNLDELLFDAIKLQSVADVPLGVLLSGGLDSSLVTYYLTQISSKVKTFSIAFNEASFDESKFAGIVSKKLGTVNMQETFSAEDIKTSFRSILEKLDEPLSDPSLFPTYKICKLAGKYVKVALSGDGGDELFGGYPTYQGHILAEKIGYLPKEGLSKIGNLLKILPKSDKNYPIIETMISFLTGLGKDDLEKHLYWMSTVPYGQKNFLDINKTSWYKEQIKKFKKKDIATTMQKLDLDTYLVDDLLTKVDRASMFNSLEVRVPMLDPRIISFAFSRKNHVDLFTTKKIIRDLSKDKLPKVIVERKKKGFGIPLSLWLKKELKSLAWDFLKNKKLQNYFDQTYIEEIWKNHQSGRENNARIIWMLVMFSGWLKVRGRNND